MKRLFLSILAGLLAVGTTNANIINVPADQQTIQAGINAATDGDTVLVQPGNYIENINFLGKNIVVGSLFLTTGDTANISQTIIDGNAAGSVVTFASGEVSSVLTGFTIQNGLAYQGGGIYSMNSSPILDNVIISGNIANEEGGGIYHIYNVLTISNCAISNNSAAKGGGMICHWSANASIKNTTITNNTSGAGGGGITSWDSNINLEHVTVEGNIASTWGGGIDSYRSNVTVTNCDFIGNEARDGTGGGINCTYGQTFAAFSVAINNTVVENNSATNRSGGIHVATWDSISVEVSIDNCDITNNVAGAYTGLYIRGKGVHFNVSNCLITENEAKDFAAGGGFSSNSTGIVSNCLIASNNAATDGGIWNSGGLSVWSGANVDFLNCTFADNSAAYGDGLTVGGGGMATATNCIFWGNSSEQIALATWSSQGGTLMVNYCDIQGARDSVNVVDALSTLNWGIGNTDENPLFVDPGNRDFRLQDASPCIGAGIDSIEIAGVWLKVPITDIAGNTRPNPAGSMPDLGAYESPFALPVGVANHSSKEIPEFFVLRQNYPNPFNPSTTIEFALAKRSAVQLKVFDIVGREVATLVDEAMTPGRYKVAFEPIDLSSGVYFYRITAGEFMQTKRLLLLK
ncbi:MAG: T9SS type A sorting domain-containing protein [bacterium]